MVDSVDDGSLVRVTCSDLYMQRYIKSCFSFRSDLESSSVM